MKRMVIYIITLLFIPLLTGCVISEPNLITESMTNGPYPKRFEGEGENAVLSLDISNDIATIEYEFTNNTGQDIDMQMNNFYRYRTPLFNVFPLAVRISNHKGEIVRFYVIVDDAYFEDVTQQSPSTGLEDSPATGYGYINNRIETDETIRVMGDIIDSGMWPENYNKELNQSVNSLPSGNYKMEIYLFDNGSDTIDMITPSIIDKYQSTVSIIFSI